MNTTIFFFLCFSKQLLSFFFWHQFTPQNEICHIAHITLTMRCLEAGESPLLSVLCQWYLFILFKSNLVWTSTKIPKYNKWGDNSLWIRLVCSHHIVLPKAWESSDFMLQSSTPPLKNVLVSWKEVRKLISSLVAIFSFPVLWLEFHHHLTYHSLTAKVDLD